MEFRILGPLEVATDGRSVRLGPGKQRALLAALVLHAGEIVPTDRLVEEVWGEHPPRTAAHSVQIYVSELRKALETPGQAPLIETRPPGYLLRADPEAIDARRFERLVAQARGRLDADDPAGAVDLIRSALDLWRGSPLSDFTYEEFAQPEIQYLTGLHLDALELLADAELELGHAREALSPAETAIGEDPLRERGRELQMLALYRTGRHAEALRAYQRFGVILAEEAGLDPSPSLRRLQERILVHDPALAPPAERPAAVRNPYKGLRPFDEHDADDFFGREELVRQLVDALAHGTRLLAVVGPSGCGKSSVVNAGLIPAIRKGAVVGSEGWVITQMMPGRGPLEELGVTLSSAGVEGARDDSASVLMTAAAEGCASRDLLLLIDQFEEVFSAAEELQRERLLDVLVSVAAERHGRVRVVLTLRGDFYDRPLLHPAFARVFVPSVVSVLPMTTDEVEAAIVGPAERVGVQVEPSLLAELVADTVGQAGALPFLQFALTELFERRTGGRLGIGAYREMGGLRGVVSGRAEEAYGSLDEGGRELALQVFLRMVRVGAGARHSRRRVRLWELTALGADPVALSQVLEAFGRHRLLSFDRDPATGDPTVEVAHEALLWEWERLAGWIERHRTDVRRRAAISAAAEEWRSSSRQVDYLLTGRRLAEYEEWAGGTDLRLASPELEFLDASIRRREEEQEEESARLEAHGRLELRARRRLLALTGAVVLLTAALTYGVLAWLGARPPDVALVWEGGGNWGGVIDAGFDRAVSDFDLRAMKVSASENGFDPEIRRLSEEGVDLIVVGSGGGDVNTIAREFPDTRYVWIDYLGGPTDLPNVSYVIFADADGSFLAGAAAALKSQTGTIGFVGGVDIPLIHEFQAGYEAGARWVDPSIEVRSRYLTEHFDLTGFESPTLAWHVAERLYRHGVDVIYHAAGYSGWGVFRAAAEMRGRHVWVIGVDVDQYRSFAALDPRDMPSEIDIEAWPAHVLTSMVKRMDVAVHTVLEEWSRGIFTPGAREFGLAVGGVGLAFSGGFIDDIRPELERLRDQIVSGQIDVPEIPSRMGG